MWREIELRSNTSGKGELIFYRKRSDNQIKGYWAIDDIHFCNQKIGSNCREQLICVIYLYEYS
jgi:hypothetical protein